MSVNLNPVPTEIVEKVKVIMGFGPEDVENLKALQPIVDRHADAVTEAFYDRISQVPETAKLLEGRLESLKKTHKAWVRSLVAGEYGEAYFAYRWRIGLTHVRVGLDPYWVEGVMSFIRTSIGIAIAGEISDSVELANKHASFVKVCDLDLAIINLSYTEERLERLTDFTGLKRSLMENIIRLPRQSG